VKRAVYAGSFDPPTNGHLYMIREGARLFDELIVAVGVNPDKRSTFTVGDRLSLLRSITSDLRNVHVDSFENQFLVKYAVARDAAYVLRGIRNATDFEYERTMRHVNADMAANVTTVFLVPPRELTDISSSFVKTLVGPDGWPDIVRQLVPRPVFDALIDLHATARDRVAE
jgi:pantetheine-phosphate adenylyltransferase